MNIVTFTVHQQRNMVRTPHFFWAGDATAAVLCRILLSSDSISDITNSRQLWQLPGRADGLTRYRGPVKARIIKHAIMRVKVCQGPRNYMLLLDSIFILKIEDHHHLNVHFLLR